MALHKNGSSHKKESAKTKTNKRVSKLISAKVREDIPVRVAVPAAINIIKQRKKKAASAKARKTRRSK